MVLTHITIKLNEGLCFKKAPQRNIFYYESWMRKTIWVCPVCDSYQQSEKLNQVFTSIRVCSVRVPPMSLINWIWFYPSALHLLPLHLLRTSFPKAANQGGRDRPQGMGLDVGAFLSVWSWANYSESQLPFVTLGLGIPAS